MSTTLHSFMDIFETTIEDGDNDLFTAPKRSDIF